jgi:hypothetical protein
MTHGSPPVRLGQFATASDGEADLITMVAMLHHLDLHDTLGAVLTSRFPFADLETFDGSSARMLELPAFTEAEGAALLGAGGGGWLSEAERRDPVAAVDGHALAVTVLAGLLVARPPAAALAEDRARSLGLPEIRLYTNEAMTENLAYYPPHGYTETHRAQQDGFHRVYFRKRLDS